MNHLKRIIHYFRQTENRQKLCRRALKAGGYFTLGTVAVAILTGCLFLYCISH